MIYFPKSKLQVSWEAPVSTGNSITAEGQALMSDVAAGVGGVKPTAGSSDTVFLGFAVSDMLSITSFPKVEDFVITGSTFTLSRTPQASTLAVYDVTAGAALALTTDYTLATATVTLVTPASQLNHTLRAFYRWAPTTVEAQALQGDIRPGGAPGALLGQVGIAKSGIMYTSEYDTSVNWLAANPVIKTAASGRVTIGGSGLTIRGWVISAPNSSGPDGAFLGIEFSAD
jgi:hypothetical protein